LKRIVLITLLLAAPAASLVSRATAQDASLVAGFADGFTFHSHVAANRKVDSDSAVVYSRDGGGNTHIASVRQGAAPCVFLSNSLNLNEGISGTPVVMFEETYDLRGVSFEADAKHRFAPPGGLYLTMKGPHILCRVSTGGSGGALKRTAQCQDRFEATIDEQMMPAFKAASERLKALCNWK
jgi:hypothetical protein